jgi:hypothetical protein
VFIALQSVFFSCKYRKTPVFTGKKSFIALGSGGRSWELICPHWVLGQNV